MRVAFGSHICTGSFLLWVDICCLIVNYFPGCDL